MVRTHLTRATLAAALLAAVCAAGEDGVPQKSASRWVTSTLQTYDPTEWKYWGGDAGQTRYAPLDQVRASNVDRLKIAWRWSADTTGSASAANFKSTPLLDDGVLYVPWVNHGAKHVIKVSGAPRRTRSPASFGALNAVSTILSCVIER
jgi:glucose dehydrogenase